MTEEDMQFWRDIDNRIIDIIELIRLKYPKFAGTPIEKTMIRLNQAYVSNEKVCDAIDKGWL